MEGKEPFAASDNGSARGSTRTSLTWGRWGHRGTGGVVAMEAKGWDVENQWQGRSRAQGSVNQPGAARLSWQTRAWFKVPLN